MTRNSMGDEMVRSWGFWPLNAAFDSRRPKVYFQNTNLAAEK